MDIKIRELDFGVGDWRIDPLSTVSPYEQGASETKIKVPVTRLTDEYKNPLAKGSQTTEQKTVHLRAGLLPVLQPGSVWRSGSCHQYPQQNHDEPFHIDTKTAIETTMGGTISHNGIELPALPKIYYPLGSHYSHLKDAPMLALPVAQNRCKFLLIPKSELLRSYYVVSDVTARCVLENDIQYAIDLEESRVLTGDVVQVSLLKDVADDEAWVLARWLTSDVMRDQIERLSRTMMATLSNQARNRAGQHPGAHVDIGFPFEGTSNLTVSGKRIRLSGFPNEKNAAEEEVWAFLCLRILSCTHPLPFSDVLAPRKNDGSKGKNHEDTTLPTMDMDAKQASAQPGHDEVQPIPIEATKEPLKLARRFALDTFTQRFPSLFGRKVLREEKDLQKYRHLRTKVSGKKLVEAFSTGIGASGTDDIGQLRIGPGNTSHRTRSSADWELEDFLEVIMHLKRGNEKESADWKISTIGVFGRAQATPSGELISFMPLKLPKCRTWHLVQEKPPIPRRIVIAQIVIADRFYYLLEIERKSVKHSTCLVFDDAYAQIPDSKFERFFRIMASHKQGWPPPAYIPSLIRRPINHPDKVSVPDFAAKIIRIINQSS